MEERKDMFPNIVRRNRKNGVEIELVSDKMGDFTSDDFFPFKNKTKLPSESIMRKDHDTLRREIVGNVES